MFDELEKKYIIIDMYPAPFSHFNFVLCYDIALDPVHRCKRLIYVLQSTGNASPQTPNASVIAREDFLALFQKPGTIPVQPTDCTSNAATAASSANANVVRLVAKEVFPVVLDSTCRYCVEGFTLSQWSIEVVTTPRSRKVLLHIQVPNALLYQEPKVL